MKGYLTKAEAEIEDTDELPVLSEEAVLEVEARRSNPRSYAVEPEPPSSERDLSLLERIAYLEQYIAGRAERWRRMELDLETRSRRIAELEIELAQRIARERHLEERLHDEGDRSNALRKRLRMLNRQLETAADGIISE